MDLKFPQESVRRKAIERPRFVHQRNEGGFSENAEEGAGEGSPLCGKGWLMCSARNLVAVSQAISYDDTRPDVSAGGAKEGVRVVC